MVMEMRWENKLIDGEEGLAQLLMNERPATYESATEVLDRPAMIAPDPVPEPGPDEPPPPEPLPEPDPNT